MNPDDIVHFLPSEVIYPKSVKIFNEQRILLLNLLGKGIDIQHVGSGAVPKMIGKMDTDIQIRVPRDQFTNVVRVMSNHFQIKHPQIWTEDFAAFSNNTDNLIDLVVTVINSRYDDFYRVRDALIENPELLQKYNELKESYEGKLYSEYRKAKSEFLGGNGQINFLTY